LGIVEKLCKEFDASLELESTVGVGSRFKIQFKPAMTSASTGGEVAFGKI
jgi:signal transduction histidine kinase